jgi:hypothetical protein
MKRAFAPPRSASLPFPGPSLPFRARTQQGGSGIPNSTEPPALHYAAGANRR